jgi:hypothetical protein
MSVVVHASAGSSLDACCWLDHRRFNRRGSLVRRFGTRTPRSFLRRIHHRSHSPECSAGALRSPSRSLYPPPKPLATSFSWSLGGSASVSRTTTRNGASASRCSPPRAGTRVRVGSQVRTGQTKPSQAKPGQRAGSDPLALERPGRRPVMRCRGRTGYLPYRYALVPVLTGTVGTVPYCTGSTTTYDRNRLHYHLLFPHFCTVAENLDPNRTY